MKTCDNITKHMDDLESDINTITCLANVLTEYSLEEYNLQKQKILSLLVLLDKLIKEFNNNFGEFSNSLYKEL